LEGDCLRGLQPAALAILIARLDRINTVLDLLTGKPGPRRDFGPGGLALKVTATMIIAEMGAAMSPTSMQSR
ncbi:MAG: hypothetical protein WA813_08740, partial [Beijerinckiaceae bacterium]